MRCFIFGSAKIESYDYLKELDFKDSLVICADGGIKHTKALGIVPDIWVGDGDSSQEALTGIKECHNFPIRKDNTDTDLAVELALKKGCSEIIILGGLGGRRDHEFSHFCLLKKILDNGAKGILMDDKNEITMENKSFKLYPNKKKHISFFPFAGDVSDFSVKGLRYEAEKMYLSCNKVQASSNCFDKQTEATVTFGSGYVLIILSND